MLILGGGGGGGARKKCRVTRHRTKTPVVPIVEVVKKEDKFNTNPHGIVPNRTPAHRAKLRKCRLHQSLPPSPDHQNGKNNIKMWDRNHLPESMSLKMNALSGLKPGRAYLLKKTTRREHKVFVSGRHRSVLFVSGAQAPNRTPAHRAELREYRL